MPTVKAKLHKGFPTCPQCKYTHKGGADEYGVDRENDGYYFIFICPVCSAKKTKGKPKTTLKVKYFADVDFNLIQRRGKGGEEQDD